MNLQDFVYPLGEFMDWTFGLLEFLGNYPNIAIVFLGFVGISLWMVMQHKYNKKAEAEGTLK